MKETALGNGPTKYAVFTGKDGAVETVKLGFSWPGFFFPPIWALIKGFYWIGLSLLFVSLVLNVSSRECAPGTAPWGLLWLCSLVARCIVGGEGNEWRRKRLRKRGYTMNCIVHASSDTEADSLFRRHQKVSPPPIPPMNTGEMPPESNAPNWTMPGSEKAGRIPVPPPSSREDQPSNLETMHASCSIPRATEPQHSTPSSIQTKPRGVFAFIKRKNTPTMNTFTHGKLKAVYLLWFFLNLMLLVMSPHPFGQSVGGGNTRTYGCFYPIVDDGWSHYYLDIRPIDQYDITEFTFYSLAPLVLLQVVRLWRSDKKK